jgi:hypothetical protein
MVRASNCAAGSPRGGGYRTVAAGGVRAVSRGWIVTGVMDTIPAFDDVRTAAGRRAPEDITVFDSSGVALQDLAVATAVLDAHDGTGRHEGI